MTNDFTKGSPAKAILLFSLPMLLGNIFQQLYSTVDAIVVGRYVGKSALAAVSSTWSSVILVLAIALGFANGISVVVSQLYGAGDYDKLRRAFSTAIFLSLGFVVVLTAVGLLLSPTLLRLLRVPADIFADSLLYIRIGFATLFGTFLFNGLSGIMRAMGDSRTPLRFLIIASITNIVLDLLFVAVLHWGVAGAAVATAIGQILSGVLSLMYVWRRVDVLRLGPGEWVFDKEMMKNIARYGLPAAAQTGVFSMGMMAIQGLVNSFGTDMIAAFSAANRIEDFAAMPLYNLATALSLFAGQNIGAGQHKNAGRGLRDTLLMMAAICAVVAIALPSLARHLICLFVKEEETAVISAGIASIRFIACFYFIDSVTQAFSSFLQGAGDAVYTMVASTAQLAVRIPLAYILAANPSIGYMAIWYSLPASWAVACVLAVSRYFTGKWKTKGIATSKNPLPQE